MSDSNLRPTVAGEDLTRDSWREWRQATPARIALGRAGSGLPTDEVLRFAFSHAMARDAIHVPLDAQALLSQLAENGWKGMHVNSAASDRMMYLRRPDLGRQLDVASAAALSALQVPAHADICFVIGDGLSSLASARHAVALLEAIKPYLKATQQIVPVVIVATQARVALADEVGEILKARLVVMLIGERPGLSSPDSLGCYITYAPRHGCSDAQRNCISNIRPEGLSYEVAAFKLMWLVGQALKLGLSGVALKDESELQRMTHVDRAVPGVTQ